MAPGPALGAGGEGPALPTEPLPPQIEDVPTRPGPLLELGDPFLETGEISKGFTIPTGAVWRPQLQLYGTIRSALQHFDPGPGMRDEWVNRGDLFANLQLSPTERAVFGTRFLDLNGRFSGIRFNPDASDGGINEVNLRIRTAFFEGDFSQLFPVLDPEGQRRLDWGFSVGRQPLLLQDGLLVNEAQIDMLGIVRNNLFLPWTTQGRLTAMYGWNRVNRANNTTDDSAEAYGLFFEADMAPDVFDATVNAELLFIDSDTQTDAMFYSASATGVLFNRFNTTFSFVHSDARGADGPVAGDGTVFFLQTNFHPTGSRNFVYGSAFWGMDQFTSAMRSPGTGNALGRAGILFAGVGIGGFGAALSNAAQDAYGGAIGYQMFFKNFRRQLILEFGGREEYQGAESGAWAVGFRYQDALTRRLLLQFQGFIGERFSTGGMNGLALELNYAL